MPEAGILDLLHPVLNAIDRPLSVWLSPLPRLMLWTAVAVMVPWWLYRWLLPAARLRQWQQELAFQRQMRTTFKSMGAALPGNRWKVLRLMALIGLFRVPITVLTAALFIMIAAWLPHQFAYTTPWPGEWVVVRPVPATFPAASVSWQPARRAAWSGDLQAWVVQWPSAEQTVRFVGADGRELFALHDEAMGTQIVPRRWWHNLLANPAGYLSEHPETQQIKLQRVDIELTAMEYLPWGPPWASLRHASRARSRRRGP